VSAEFLTIGRGVPARSPMERLARAAGARFEVRDGWNVAVDYAGAAPPGGTGWADLSHLAKLELHGPREARPGMAEYDGEAWWCPVAARRTLVLAEPSAAAGLRERLASFEVVDVTGAYAALAVVGPQVREVLARLTALDLRPAITPVGAFRPGSVARTPAMVLKEGEERFLVLFGAALAEYMWTVVSDAARHLGGGPLTVDRLPAPVPEASRA
jgi:heterotetrameric sarcosine oxidase gamma subunit